MDIVAQIYEEYLRGRKQNWALSSTFHTAIPDAVLMLLLKEEIYVGGFKLINARMFCVCLLAPAATATACHAENLDLNANTSGEVTVPIKYAKELEWIC